MFPKTRLSPRFWVPRPGSTRELFLWPSCLLKMNFSLFWSKTNRTCESERKGSWAEDARIWVFDRNYFKRALHVIMEAFSNLVAWQILDTLELGGLIVFTRTLSRLWWAWGVRTWLIDEKEKLQNGHGDQSWHFRCKNVTSIAYFFLFKVSRIPQSFNFMYNNLAQSVEPVPSTEWTTEEKWVEFTQWVVCS